MIHSANISPDAPAFLVGAHRSGTTLLGLMLDSHPHLSWFHHFEWAVKYIDPAGHWPTVECYRARLAADAGYQDWQLSIDPEAPSYPAVLNGFLQQRRERDGKPFSGATLHTRYLELPKLWPQARFIHIVRDPRDAARSRIQRGWSGNAWGAAQRWKAAEQQWHALCQQVPEARRYCLRFEDLITAPVETLQGLMAFLGLPYTDELFSYTQRTPYAYPDPQMVLKWQTKMSPREVEMVELAAGEWLDIWGYQRLSDRRSASRLECLTLTLADRWQKFRWRLRHYGWRLWLIQFLARRLGTPHFLAGAIAQAKAIDEQTFQAHRDRVADPNAGSRGQGSEI